jgi:hypothetical protein
VANTVAATAPEPLSRLRLVILGIRDPVIVPPSWF